MHAVRGTGGDPTRGLIRRAVILLAVPMVLEMVMESLFAVVDIYFVSRLGNEAMAGVALTESVLSLIYTLAMGLSIGVTAVVSRRIGGGDREGAARAAAQAVLLGLALAVVFGIAGVAFAPDILRIMGADENVVATGVPYTRILLGGNVVILLLFLQNAAFRGAGDAAIAMRVLWIANGLNIVLDPLLIFGLGPFPEMGVQGAAIATTIGRGTAVLVQVYTLFRLGGKLRIRLAASRNPACAHGPARPALRDWNASDLHRDRELDRADARDGAVRGRGAGGIRGRDPDHTVRHPARLGTLQRGRDHGRAGAWGRGPGARRARRCGSPAR